MADHHPSPVYTLGHSTHAWDDFLDLLRRHQIRLLADIRRFPGSRKFPHFSRDSLAIALPAEGIEYRWFESLGGRRPKQSQSSDRNLGLRNASFRNYADYMATEEFQQSVDELLGLAEHVRVAMMCSEGLYWRCHRRLVSDYLLLKGITAQHILPSGELRPHALTPEASLAGGELTYPPPADRQSRLPFE